MNENSAFEEAVLQEEDAQITPSGSDPEEELQPEEEPQPEEGSQPEEELQPEEGSQPEEELQPEEEPRQEEACPAGEQSEETPDSADVPAAEDDAPEPAADPDEPDIFGRRPEKPYHQRFYLLYGNDPRTAYLDLQGTKNFLKENGFDGGELRQARKGKDFSESIANTEAEDGQQSYCAYCGTAIAGAEYYRLPDGRMRCTNCSRTLVKTKAAVQDIYDRVTANLDSFFGATINVPVEIELLDERRLKKKLKAPLSVVDNKSILILGAAVSEKKKYTIYLENGAPRISIIATFAHELTHIWQYSHWDNMKGFPKCPKNTRLLIYEGMAKWVEIQYLYLVGETAAAMREEAFTRKRDDEYGIGFRIYDDQYPITREAMSCESTPFTTQRYPVE